MDFVHTFSLNHTSNGDGQHFERHAQLPLHIAHLHVWVAQASSIQGASCGTVRVCAYEEREGQGTVVRYPRSRPYLEHVGRGEPRSLVVQLPLGSSGGGGGGGGSQ